MTTVPSTQPGQASARDRVGAVAAGAVARERSGSSVELRGLRRSYGSVVALDSLDLALVPGELVALLGPSGCGKTTALRLLAGLEQPDAGHVLVDGVDITGRPANRRDMGMVFQAYSLFPNMTAEDNVAFGLRMRKHRASERRARARQLLELIGLDHHAQRYPHQLSGGQQQRVALARALAIEPTVLLLDEPLSALDAKVREQLRDEIRRLQMEVGITTLFVTHDQEEALSMADRVGVMSSGRLEQIDSPDVVYSRPSTAFVAEFVGAMNRLPARATEPGQALVLDTPVSLDPDSHLPMGAACEVLVRPEAVAVEVDPSGVWTVVSRSFRGGLTRVVIAGAPVTGSGEDLTIVADLTSAVATGMTPGVRVRARVTSQRLMLAAPRAAAA
ncbi:MAG: ABC transporter ATP-binding protein [Actinomycetes bacterium]